MFVNKALGNDNGSAKNQAEINSSDPGATLLFNLEIERYERHFLIVLFLLVVALVLLVFNETILQRLAQKIPESVLLIIVGIIAGVTAKYAYIEELNILLNEVTADTFFNILLPPIILDAAYQLYCKQFIFNLDGIILMALLGTALNIFAIGISLWLTYSLGMGNDFSLTEMLMLSAIVAAVDPVAVLAVFDQLGVQRSLYILIFGESLLNDGVTVVIFDTLEKIAFTDVSPTTYVWAVLSFFPVAFGGTLIGVIYGLLSSLACKYTSPESKTLEPMLIILCAYLSFLNAQFFHWSGILALIGCGLVQKRYGFENTYEKSRVTIELGVGILATISEAIIFLILGFKVLDSGVVWEWKLLLLTLFYCLGWRLVITFAIGWGINSYRLHKLTYQHMLMVWYGGLRGAVSFAMVSSIENEKVAKIFMGTTLFIILVTVGVKGSSIQPLVNLFRFREQAHADNFTSTTIASINFYVLAGMETILGGGGSTIHYWLEKLERFDRRCMQPLMCKEGSDEKRFATILKHQGRGDNIQNNVLWGSQDYAKKRLAKIKTEEGSTRTQMTAPTKIKDIGKFKRAIQKSRSGSTEETSVFITDERLNDAWKRKLELIKAIKQVGTPKTGAENSKAPATRKRKRDTTTGNAVEKTKEPKKTAEET